MYIKSFFHALLHYIIIALQGRYLIGSSQLMILLLLNIIISACAEDHLTDIRLHNTYTVHKFYSTEFYDHSFFNHIPYRNLEEIRSAYCYYSELKENQKASEYYKALINKTYSFKEIPLSSNIHKAQFLFLDIDPLISLCVHF